MNNKLEEPVLDIKTPRLNETEAYVLTQNMFDILLILICSDLNKAQFYKTPCRIS